MNVGHKKVEACGQLVCYACYWRMKKLRMAFCGFELSVWHFSVWNN